MIFKGHGTKTSQMFLGKSLLKIIGQLHLFRNEKIDAFGAHEAESVDNHKKPSAYLPTEHGVWG